MAGMIYILIIVLFAVYILWTWNNTKSFEGILNRISYLCIGTVFIALATYIIFNISNNGVNYPEEEMEKLVRNMILLVFIPMNGFCVLPQIGNIIGKIKNDEISNEKLKRKIITFVISIIILIIFEIFYLKNTQTQIIAIMNVLK